MSEMKIPIDYKIEETELFVILTSEGICQFRKDGTTWMGGGGKTHVEPALFNSRKEAIMFKKAWLKECEESFKERIKWTVIKSCRIAIKVNKK